MFFFNIQSCNYLIKKYTFTQKFHIIKFFKKKKTPTYLKKKIKKEGNISTPKEAWINVKGGTPIDFHDAYKITIRAQVSVTWLVTQLWMGNVHVGNIRISNPNSKADTSSRNPREKKNIS